MNLEDNISIMKSQELAEIEKAAKEGNVSAVVYHTRIVETLEKLLSQLQQIVKSFEKLKLSSLKQKFCKVRSDISHKERGRLRRTEFLEAARKNGIEIIPIKGVRFRIGENKVGIASASEVQPNKWWLGLPMDNYDIIVLLCENENGEMSNFILPKAFCEKYKYSFSMDQDRQQLKFNIEIRGGRYTMKLPGKDDTYINEYIDAFNNLYLCQSSKEFKDDDDGIEVEVVEAIQ